MIFFIFALFAQNITSVNSRSKDPCDHKEFFGEWAQEPAKALFIKKCVNFHAYCRFITNAIFMSKKISANFAAFGVFSREKKTVMELWNINKLEA